MSKHAVCNCANQDNPNADKFQMHAVTCPRYTNPRPSAAANQAVECAEEQKRGVRWPY